MANVLVAETSLEAIADTIRSKLGVSDTYLPSEMAGAISDIGGGITPTGTINIAVNGTYDVTNYASADVNVTGSLLPPGYTQLLYIAATGTQCISTGYEPVQGDEIDVTFLKTVTSGCLFSAGTGSYQWLFLDSQYFRYFSSGGAASISPTISNNKNYRMTGGDTLTATSPGTTTSTVTKTYGGAIDGSDKTLYIGKRANNASYYNGYLYEFKLSNGGTTKMHLIPCLRDSDSKAGMYDIISDTFYSSAGNDEFLAGQEVAK